MGNGQLCLCDSRKEKKTVRVEKIYDEYQPDYCTKIQKESLQINVVLKIIEQMKNCICKIENSNYTRTGFFCLIPYPDITHKLPVLITTYNVVDKNDIIAGTELKLIFYDKSYKILKIDNTRKIYLSEESRYNITIIEIKREDNIKYFLEIDQGIYNSNFLNYLYQNKNVYLMYFSNEVKYNINIITHIEANSENFMHLLDIEEGSLGAPILNLINNQVIGYNIGNHLGTILKGAITGFIQVNQIENIKINKIILTIKVSKEDANKTIYFLDNTEVKDFDTDQYHYHDNLKELNKDNTKLYIDNQEYPFSKHFTPKIEGIYTIQLEFRFQLTDCSYMFYFCYNLINIDLSYFDSSKVKNMSYMFALCINLIHLDLSFLDTSNATSMNNMFCLCKNLQMLNLFSFKTINVINMNGMFSDCTNIKTINLSSFDTKNVQTMENMFSLCKNLFKLDLYFDTRNVINMSHMFYFCKSLRKLDLTSFNTNKVIDMSKMFCLCKNLFTVDLSSFDTKNVINMSYMFSECKNIINLDLSSFNTKNVSDMNHFFSGCDISRLNLSSFNTQNVTNMSFMFYYCKNLKQLDISSFDTRNVRNMAYMFSGCRYLKEIDLSYFDIKNVTNMKSMFEGCISTLKIKVNKPSLIKFKRENKRNYFIL